jgi:hypothetical protein
VIPVHKVLWDQLDLLVQQALMEPKDLQDLPVLPDLKDRLALQA